MSSPLNTVSQEMSRPHIIGLLYILRRANMRYAQVAAAVRNSLRPTYHARKRARALRLSVSIEAALKLDPKQISTIPLPIIEIATPLPQEALRVRPTLRCDIPKNTHQEEMLSSVSVYSTVSLNSPASSDAQNLTSRWSMTTIDSDIEEEGEEEEDIVYSSDYEEGMDLPVSAEAELEYASFEIVSEPFGEDTNVAGQCAPRLEIPVDLSRFSWASHFGSGLSSGSSSSSANTSGRVTPGTCGQPKPQLTIRLKRKSCVSYIDMEDDTLEKRPKYDRKSWVNPTIRKTVNKMPFTRKY